jgi:hypothetical protein
MVSVCSRSLRAVNRYEAERLARLLLDAYPQVPLRERTVEIYTDWLLDFDPLPVEEAIGELIADSQQLPTVAEIRRMLVERDEELPTAAEAWISISERGHEAHDLAKEVARLFGGTWNIRTSAEPGITRAQFSKAYEATRERALREANSARFRARRRAA